MSNKLSRLLAFFTAIGIWYISFKFSVDGFGMLSPNPEYLWIGRVLAFAITAYELIWNGMKTRDNETMYWVGLGCYIYGIFTNVLGCAKWLGFTKDTILSVQSGDIWTIIVVLIYVILIIGLSVMFEAGPEPTLIYAFTGRFNGGDFIGNLMGNQFHVTNSSPPSRVAKPFGGVVPDMRNNSQNKGGRPREGMAFQNKPNSDGMYSRLGEPDPNWEDRVAELRNIVGGKK